MAAPTTKLTVIKRMPYRQSTAEEWSNTYMFSGSTPTDSAAWRTLFDALVTEEKKCYGSYVNVVGGYGYSSIADDATAIWSVDLDISPNTIVPGTLSPGSGARFAGDQAAWVRWGLDRFARGKRIYLRKYFHGMYVSAANTDQVEAAGVTALTAFGTKLRDGSFATSRTIVDKNGNVPIGAGVSTYVTTRTLKRRGKRPPTSGA